MKTLHIYDIIVKMKNHNDIPVFYFWPMLLHRSFFFTFQICVGSSYGIKIENRVRITVMTCSDMLMNS